LWLVLAKIKFNSKERKDFRKVRKVRKGFGYTGLREGQQRHPFMERSGIKDIAYGLTLFGSRQNKNMNFSTSMAPLCGWGK
jgi:hypothetical protein